ncbi:SAF domain-containing protein [uncultured Corynebacterium sp.]|uniref:SAF domain-containing protein n=1 Tax=uncultured Corynebacterium sp. TaxID=159447 RepID=UPI0025FFD5B2|nr:SAF domain-containing protein [uncultured Corynebacterium sp.]
MRFPRRRRRQALAAGLVVAAAAVALADAAGPEEGTVEVVVAARRVDSGSPITADDVVTRSVAEEHVPDHAITDVEVLVGKLPAGPLMRGEVLTESRFAGVALAKELTGMDGAHIVAVTPRDAGLTPMLRTGDVVDVLAPGPEAGTARPVARGARVVLAGADGAGDGAGIAGAGGGRGGADGVVLLALPPGAAATVASAGLDLPLTLVLSR